MIEQLQNLYSIVEGHRLGHDNDKWLWEFEDDRLLTVRSIRKLLERNRVLCQKTALVLRGVGFETHECSLCFNEKESIDHFLLNCPFASRIWDRVFEWGGWS